MLALALLVSAPALTAGCSKSEPPSPQAASAPATSTTQPIAKKVPSAAPQLAGTYRLDLGGAPPTGTSASGWSPKRDEGRHVLQLAQAKAQLRFELTRAASDYMLTGVARVAGTKQVSLQPTLNGRSLEAWSLSSQWQMFASPVPTEALAPSKSQLDFAVDTDGEAIAPGAVALGALALVPIGDRVSVPMGAETMGLLIDGFHPIEKGGLRWSKGKTSSWGAVLEPGPGPYRLIVRGAPFGPLAPIVVEARVNGKRMGAATFEGGFKDVGWSIPAGALVSGLNRVELSYSKTGKPSDHGRSKDTRELSVRVARLELAPSK